MELFQPDTVLAPQFFATLRRQGPSKRGEWLLVVAVLEDAVTCYQKYFLARDNQGRRLFREAYEWIMATHVQHSPRSDDAPAFTFEYICDVLGLDPDYIRHGLQQWQDKQLATGLAHIQALPKPAHRSGVESRAAYELVVPARAVGAAASA